MLKTHQCGEIRKSDVGKRVTLAGWVHRWRDHGGLIFLDLRDRSGLVQVVFNVDVSADAHHLASEARSEFVIQVEGTVELRPEGLINPHLDTGEVEVSGERLVVLLL
ncbi:MAG: hypothetical protein HGA44_03505, partial [Cellulomonadaceae bacterium]|nr:hypothetical protein [Cellulomonadaceae bacterium]